MQDENLLRAINVRFDPLSSILYPQLWFVGYSFTLPSSSSSRRTIVWSALIRPKRLSSDSTIVHGAAGVDVRSSISSVACSYCGHFSRLRQSSSVSFQAL